MSTFSIICCESAKVQKNMKIQTLIRIVNDFHVPIHYHLNMFLLVCNIFCNLYCSQIKMSDISNQWRIKLKSCCPKAEYHTISNTNLIQILNQIF